MFDVRLFTTSRCTTRSATRSPTRFSISITRARDFLTRSCRSRSIVTAARSFRNAAECPNSTPRENLSRIRPHPPHGGCSIWVRRQPRIPGRVAYRVALLASSGWSHAFLTARTHFLWPDTPADRAMYQRLQADNRRWRNYSGQAVEETLEPFDAWKIRLPIFRRRGNVVLSTLSSWEFSSVGNFGKRDRASCRSNLHALMPPNCAVCYISNRMHIPVVCALNPDTSLLE